MKIIIAKSFVWNAMFTEASGLARLSKKNKGWFLCKMKKTMKN